MNYFKNIYTKAEAYFVSRAPEMTIRVENEIRNMANGKKLSDMAQPDPVEPTAKSLKDWKEAIAAATDRESPDWSLLENLHDNLLLDNHLMSVIETRILYTQRSKFRMVDAEGKEVKEATALLERPWYNEAVYKALFKQYRGRKLLEFYELDENNELAQVDEIPQSMFNPVKGIITKNQGDTEGWNYRTGVFANQYLQIGRNDELGMLTQLAPIVLAKKLGLGAMLDYVDKFGVPPIFIKTDREDDTRLKELFEAAKNFKRNHFMVGRGQETFEIGNIGGPGTAPHEALMKFVNDEISKRILGGSGLVDEKSFVGSTTIQFNLTKDRFEADKLFWKSLFNAHIKPRLVKLSPVYAMLENLYFEWDDTESMTQKEIIDAIVALSNAYEIDPDYVEEKTGIKITGVKNIAPGVLGGAPPQGKQ
jgi:hypothetical protein